MIFVGGGRVFVWNILYKYYVYVAIMAIILAITRSMKWTAIVTNLVAYLFNLSSFVVNILRGTPLIPSDFLAIGTAAQVAENYTFQLRYPDCCCNGYSGVGYNVNR